MTTTSVVKIPSVVLGIEGENQAGKTSLAYTAPPPIVGFAFDMGVERALFGGRFALYSDFKVVIHEYDPKVQASPALWRGNDITIFKLPAPLQTDTVKVAGMIDLWNYFNVRIGMVAADPYVMSVVVDTMTLARRTRAEAWLETKQKTEPNRQQLIQIEYGKVNDPIRDIFTTYQGVQKNLIATHHLTDERKEMMNQRNEVVSVLTGHKVLEGLGNTYNFLDIALRLDGRKVGDEYLVTSTFRKRLRATVPFHCHPALGNLACWLT